MADRWDYYEITFSLPEGDEDNALELFEIFENLPEVKGAVFSAGNHGGHPFSNAGVERAAKAIYECETYKGTEAWEDYARACPVFAAAIREKAVKALDAATATALPSPRTDQTTEADHG